MIEKNYEVPIEASVQPKENPREHSKRMYGAKRKKMKMNWIFYLLMMKEIQKMKSDMYWMCSNTRAISRKTGLVILKVHRWKTRLI